MYLYIYNSNVEYFGNRNIKINSTNKKIYNNSTSTTPRDELEWIDTSNYTIDYGDSTCGNNNTNPRKDVFVQLLNRWKEISEKHNISYFLVYGSLIGASRNADFVPWDGDIDIMVHESFYEVLASIDNKRNFVESPDDVNFHLVVQNFFRKQYRTKHRQRQNCLGQVNIVFTISLKY